VNELYKRRDTCRLCNSNKLELVISLGKSPVSEKYLTKENLAAEQERIPLDLYFCNNCSHIQLIDIVDPNFLWSDFTFKTGNKISLVEHMEETVKNILSFSTISKDGLIIDVGSNDGTLLKCFKEAGFYNVLGVDPADEIAEEASMNGIPTIIGYMDQQTATHISKKYGQADLVTAFNVYAHADDLSSMTEAIKFVLSADGLFVFEVSYLLDVVEKMLVGTIFHEHLSYHSVISINRFLRSHELELIHVERVSEQGGSLVGYVQFQGGSFKKQGSVDSLSKIEKELKLDQIEIFKDLNHRLELLKNEVRTLITNIRDNEKTIAVYGSARSGTTLLSYFEVGKEIEFIVDDNKLKHFKYSPGDKIKVLPPETIYENRPDYLLILAWMHTDMIIEKHGDYLKNGGKFIRVFPRLKVVSIN
jgi:2-polyprenyl-3-methyl-5-hydroxy-6-metoxy-1,4-benzoquinol methylase